MSRPNHVPTRWLARLASVLAVVAMADAVLVLCGWLLEIEVLKRIVPTWTTMKFNTAIAVLAVGAGVFWHDRPRVRLVSGGIAAAIGLFTLVEHVFGVNAGIDRFAVDATAEGGSIPGRMSPSTAVGCLLLGLALVSMGWRRGLGRTIAETTAIGAGVIGSIGVLGYITGAENLYRMPGFITASVQTAVVFLLLALGCLIVVPNGVVAAHMRVRRGALALWSGFFILAVLFGGIGLLSSMRVRELSREIADRDGATARAEAPVDRTEERRVFAQRMRRIEGVTIGILIAGVVTAIGTAAAVSRVVLEGHEAVRASEERLKQAQAMVGLGVWDWDPQSGSAQWSDEMFRIYGIAPHEFTGRGGDYVRFIHPEDRAKVETAMARNAALVSERSRGVANDSSAGSTPGLLFRVCRPDGSMRWVRGAVAGQAGDADHPGRLLGVLWDVTTQVETEQTVLRERDRAQRYLDIAATMLIGLAADGTITLVNRRACEVLGYSQEQLLGRDWFAMCIGPDDRDRMRAIFRGCVRGESELPRHFENRVMTRSGERRMISWHNSLVRDDAGAIVGTLSSADDITERRIAEDAAREAEEKFRQIAENIREVFWVYDLRTERLLYVSPAYETIWGRSRSELETQPKAWFDAVHVEDRPKVESFVRRHATGDGSETYRIVRPDGAVRWIHDRSYVVRTPSGAPMRVVGIAEDITRSRDLEAQLRQAQKMEAMGTLAGGIAHDFNNILGAIVGFTQLARARAGGDEQLREYLDDISKAGQRAVDLVRQILSFSRQRKPERSIIDLVGPVEESLRLLRATIPANIELRSTLAPECGMVLADASQVHQVVVNLGTNAWHAMAPEPGVLEVLLQACTISRREAERDARLRAGRFVRLSMHDTGHGMDPATVARIFDPFFTTKGPGLGTGLGLSVVHGIVADHDGWITVDSEPGRGTTFAVYFPVVEVATPALGDPAGAIVRGHGQRVLLIDDEPALARVCRLMLEKMGYQCEAFTSADAALKALEDAPGRYDAVVTDKSMPGIGGIEVAARVAAMRPDLPVILVSGYLEAETSKFINLPGVRCALMKPLEIGAFSRALAAVLQPVSPP